MNRRNCREYVNLALHEALRAADPVSIMKQKIKYNGTSLLIDSIKLDLANYGRILVIGGGKASAGMASGLEAIIGKTITDGVVNIPDSLQHIPVLKFIDFHKSTHPVPSAKGVRGVQKMLEMVGRPSSSDLIICLISGGGSALMPMAQTPVRLTDEIDVTNLLLRSGAEIDEINTVRKHISAMKGGRLAQKLYPSTILTLIISDVVGDKLDAIASGPTVPDTTTYEDAKGVLVKYNLWNQVSASVRTLINSGLEDRSIETPKPGSRIFANVFNLLLGNNKKSCLAAASSLKKSGFNTLVLSTRVRGEAREVGKIYAGILSDIRANNLPISPPAAIVLGGETTVTMSGHGKGGRNQELVLSTALEIRGIKEIVVASMGTDGIDGPTDAAGAIADDQSVQRAQKLGVNPSNSLRTHNSYHFFKKLDDLIITGPTGTNVNDITILAVPALHSKHRPL